MSWPLQHDVSGSTTSHKPSIATEREKDGDAKCSRRGFFQAAEMINLPNMLYGMNRHMSASVCTICNLFKTTRDSVNMQHKNIIENYEVMSFC